MISGLSWKLEPHEGGAKIALVGEINESSDFAPIAAHLASSAVLDLAGIERINSCGVREWVRFVERAEKEGCQLVLERCSVPFVAQLNMIANFRGNAVVKSVYAPYFCPKCEEGRQKLIDLSSADAASSLSAETACPTCAAPMEFDDIPDMFLQFLSS